MYQFNYKKVETIEEAVNELSANPESKILAGGMTLIPTMKQRLASPEQLIDIRNIKELNFIKEESNNIVIGSTTNHYTVASSDLIKNKLSLSLKEIFNNSKNLYKTQNINFENESLIENLNEFFTERFKIILNRTKAES